MDAKNAFTHPVAAGEVALPPDGDPFAAVPPARGDGDHHLQALRDDLEKRDRAQRFSAPPPPPATPDLSASDVRARRARAERMDRGIVSYSTLLASALSGLCANTQMMHAAPPCIWSQSARDELANSAIAIADAVAMALVRT